MVDLRVVSVVLGAVAIAPLLVLELAPSGLTLGRRTGVRILGAGLFTAELLLVVSIVLRG